MNTNFNGIRNGMNMIQSIDLLLSTLIYWVTAVSCMYGTYFDLLFY